MSHVRTYGKVQFPRYLTFNYMVKWIMFEMLMWRRYRDKKYFIEMLFYQYLEKIIKICFVWDEFSKTTHVRFSWVLVEILQIMLNGFSTLNIYMDGNSLKDIYLTPFEVFLSKFMKIEYEWFSEVYPLILLLPKHLVCAIHC